MATLVTEVTSTSDELKAKLRKVLEWFRHSQTAFQPELVELKGGAAQELLELSSGDRSVRAHDAFTLLGRAASELRGTHDRLILFIDQQLDGERYSNLFSSLQQDEDGGFTGRAVVTTRDVAVLSGGLPLESYLLQQLVSINVRWVVGRPMLHKDGPTDCLFHQRIDKRLIALAVREMRLCDRCREAARQLDDAQWQSLKDVMHDVSRATCASNPQEELEELLDSRRKSKHVSALGDLVDLWRRFRAGKARFALASLLALGGLEMMDQTWWQQILFHAFGWATGSEPSALQQILGFLVVVLSVVLVLWRPPPPSAPGAGTGS